MNLLQQFSPQPIIFNFGFFIIRWYGLFIVLSLLVGLGLAIYFAKRAGKKSDDVFDLAFWLFLGGIVGARLYEVIFINWHYYQDNFLAVFKVWQGGLAIHGAIIGGALALWLWARRRHESFWQWSDIAVVALAFGQSLGRWGNYFNQELFGWPTDLPWGIFVSPEHRPPNFSQYQYFHPTFLYESTLNLILFFILFFIVKKRKASSGLATAGYFVGYALIRFFMEFIRIDVTPAWFGLRLPQLASLIMLGLVVIFLFLRKKGFIR